MNIVTCQLHPNLLGGHGRLLPVAGFAISCGGLLRARHGVHPRDLHNRISLNAINIIRGVPVGNRKQLELNACMLVPVPV